MYCTRLKLSLLLLTVAVVCTTAVDYPRAGSDDRPYTILKGRPGFWRLALGRDGVWWFLSPSGKREFLNTVTSVEPEERSRDPQDASYRSKDFKGDIDTWAKATAQRVQEYGFKGVGAWSNHALHAQNIPMSRDLNLWNSVKRGTLIFSPKWKEDVESSVLDQVPDLRDNTNLIGYFLDNELGWTDADVGPRLYFDHLAPTDPNREEVAGVIHALWKSPQALSNDWHVPCQSWHDLDSWTALPEMPDPVYQRLLSAWLSHLSEEYFRVTTSLVHNADSNHLILGVRFHGYAPPEVVTASRNFTDAQSVNVYVADAKLDQALFSTLHDQSGQPVIVSEYSFQALDGRSGNRNTCGFPGQVPDQQARADGYRLFTSRLARVPYIIGADWFQWNDEPQAGRQSDGEDVNFGIVDVFDQPYHKLVHAVQETEPLLNGLHAVSSLDPQTGVWRIHTTDKPTFVVPHLKTCPDSGAWDRSATPPDQTRDALPQLPDIKLDPVVGAERFALPTPIVRLGWCKDGLYLDVRVFDSDIDASKGSDWWAKDCVEFWIETHATTPDANSYDRSSHQFFYLPTRGSGRHSDGEVGQWHRPGDALPGNLIPHPIIRQHTVFYSDGYQVRIFIPASALNGFQATAGQTIAFNVHVRNYQHSLDYFWSASKEARTEVRPSTWGELTLGD